MADDERFEELYAYYPAVVSFLLKLGFSREAARDLGQEVFVRVYRNMETYRGESKWTFLKQIAHRLALNEIRARHTAKREGQAAPAEELDAMAAKQPAADEVIERQQSSDRLQRAIAKLEPDAKAIVMLQLADHSYNEMAEIIGISVAAVKSRLYVARGRLRELLGGEADGLGGE